MPISKEWSSKETGGLKSEPPKNALKVENLYVELIDGNPKLRVIYEKET